MWFHHRSHTWATAIRGILKVLCKFKWETSEPIKPVWWSPLAHSYLRHQDKPIRHIDEWSRKLHEYLLHKHHALMDITITQESSAWCFSALAFKSQYRYYRYHHNRRQPLSFLPWGEAGVSTVCWARIKQICRAPSRLWWWRMANKPAYSPGDTWVWFYAHHHNPLMQQTSLVVQSSLMAFQR